MSLFISCNAEDIIIKKGEYIMKKYLIMILMLLLVIPFTILAAEGGVYSPNTVWVKINNDTGKQLDMDWYYAPEYTKLNAQGRLDTWTKSVYTGNTTLPDLTQRDYTRSHVFANPAFDKQMTTEWSDYKADGTLIEKYVNYDSFWQDIKPDVPFEKCLEEALNYIKNN